MGDPRKTRKNYETPQHPWNKEMIDEEKVLLREYGLKNKKEMYKMGSMLKKYKDMTKKLIALKTAQAEKEKEQMLTKLNRIGLLEVTSSLDPVLDLGLNDIMERRLQTQVCKKGLARTTDQARQFIVHGHITINGKKITSPSYILTKQEEGTLNFSASSKLNDVEHPERFVQEENPVKEEKKKSDDKKPKRPGERKPHDNQGRRNEPRKKKKVGEVKNG